MRKPLACLFFAIILLVGACVNDAPSNKPLGENNLGPQTKSEPDQTDLLDVLQGNWQSEQDPNYRIDIAGNKMKHINGGMITLETEIAIDAKCQNNSCKVEGDDTSDGWCFVEKHIPDGSQEQCNVVLKCDKLSLQYRTIGGLTNMFSFKKIP